MPSTIAWPKYSVIQYDGANSAEVVAFVEDMPNKMEPVIGSSVDGGTLTIAFAAGSGLVVTPSDWVIPGPQIVGADQFAAGWVTREELA